MYLENKAGIIDATIYDSINYKILEDILNNYCSAKTTTETKQIIQNITKTEIACLPQEKDKKLSTLASTFTKYKERTLEVQENTGTDDDFCQKRYIDYALMSKIKKDFTTILNDSDLRDTQNSIFENTNRKDDTIL
jgi:hypothetical protein